MTDDTYKRAVDITNRINHIDELLSFIENHYKSCLSPTMNLREVGFIAHPKESTLDKKDIKCLLDSLENNKRKLEQEFRML